MGTDDCPTCGTDLLLRRWYDSPGDILDRVARDIRSGRMVSESTNREDIVSARVDQAEVD